MCMHYQKNCRAFFTIAGEGKDNGLHLVLKLNSETSFGRNNKNSANTNKHELDRVLMGHYDYKEIILYYTARVNLYHARPLKYIFNAHVRLLHHTSAYVTVMCKAKYTPSTQTVLGCEQSSIYLLKNSGSASVWWRAPPPSYCSWGRALPTRGYGQRCLPAQQPLAVWPVPPHLQECTMYKS